MYPIPANVLTMHPNNDNASFGSVMLNHITVGSSLQQRSSNRIFMRNVVLNLGVDFDPIPQSNHHATVRLALVYDKECRTSGALPWITDVFDSADPLSQTKIEARDRFDILWLFDWSNNRTPFWNGSSVQYAGGNGEGTKRFVIPIKRTTIFDLAATGGAYADVTRGALIFMALYPAGYSATFSPRVYYTYRITFDDIV